MSAALVMQFASAIVAVKEGSSNFVKDTLLASNGLSCLR